MRLAQRKAELDATREMEDDVVGDVRAEVQEREVLEGHERFKRLFESSDDEEEEGETGEAGKVADEKKPAL